MIYKFYNGFFLNTASATKENKHKPKQIVFRK